MNTKKVAWCCAKHELTTEQANRLAELCGMSVEEMEIIHIPIQWKATELSYDDVRENCQVWRNILHAYDVVTGVFPPVAMESLATLRDTESELAYSKCVFTPISSVVRVTLGGKTIKRLVFHRWMEV